MLSQLVQPGIRPFSLATLTYLPLPSRPIIHRDAGKGNDQSRPGEVGLIDDQQQTKRSAHDNIHDRQHRITKSLVGTGMIGFRSPQYENAYDGEHVKHDNRSEER